MLLSDLSTRKRHDTLWIVLQFVLQDLANPVGTPALEVLLRHRLAYPSSEAPLVMTWLKKVAPLCPQAAQTGEVIKAYGRYGRRWIWSPPIAAMTALERAGIVDTSEW